MIRRNLDACPRSLRRFVGFTAAALILLLLQPPHALAQGYPPDQAAAHMTVPEGFAVNLFASEPEIRQPVTIDFDHRGRLWVVQYIQYPNPAGLERVEVDRWSRTKYDRVPEPPPHGPRGADRITICEDLDGDGVADTFKDFVDGLNLASGLAFGPGGVYVLQVPYLLFYPDRDRDDIPDSDPEVCLVGFGMEDSHSVANSLVFGPDGWLYGLQGSTVTANIRGIEFQQGVWRYHPESKEFELFAEGGGNMWGLDFNRWGDLFASTNVGPALCLHGVQGGYYWKSFGKHGDLHNPYAYGYFDQMVEPDYVGGHVTVGGLFYRGPSFPSDYFEKYIGGNLLSHDVYWHTITPTGSTYKANHGGVLLQSNDPWCAPTDVALAPDGAVFFSDWFDQRTAHPDPDAEWDRENGRVYRIQWKDFESEAPPDLSKTSSLDLIENLRMENPWHVRFARILLAERRDAELHPLLLDRIWKDSDETRRLEALWGLEACGGFDDNVGRSLLAHPDPHVRRWSARLMGDEKQVASETGAALIELARSEPNVRVRSQLASTAKRIQPEFGLKMVLEMTARDLDSEDPHLPLLLWWAVEAHSVKSLPLTLDLFTGDRIWSSNLFQKEILPRLVRRYAADGSEAADRAALRLLDRAPDPSPLLVSIGEGWSDRGRRLRGMQGGTLFTGYAAEDVEIDASEERVIVVAHELALRLVSLREARPNDPALLSLLARIGDEATLKSLRRRAFDPGAPDDVRAESLKILAEVRDSESREAFLARIERPDRVVPFDAAIEGVRRTAADEDGPRLVEAYVEAGEAERTSILETILGREAWTLAFLREVESGGIAVESVPLDRIRRSALFENPEIDRLVSAHWGAMRVGTPEEKLAEMRRLANDLRAGAGDPERGRETFERLCAICHVYRGEGSVIGPDLDHANRSDREFLLVSLVDPSLVVRKEYMQLIVTTRDEELYNGVPVEKTAREIVLANANGERVAIPLDEVDDIRESDLSLMPEDLLKDLSPQELRDLFAHLERME